MTKIVIVGEAYYSDLRPDQGLPPGQPPSIWPSPGYPAHPIAPGGPPLGIWGGIAPPVPTHPWVPPSGETLPPPPDEIANSYVAAVWNPTKQEWRVTVSDDTTATPK